MGPHAEFALVLVLSAAFLHATWNAMLKHASERAVTMGLIALAHVLFGIVLAYGAPVPAPASWPYIAASTVIHWFYYWFLLAAYRLGDLSQVYPIARGAAPLIVATTGWLVAGEALNPAGWTGIAMTSFGIMVLAFTARDGRSDARAIGAALLTGAMIASYSVVDGLGVRVAETPLGYIGWLFVLEGCVMFYIFWRERGRLAVLSPRVYLMGIGGGALSATAYGIVIFAATLAPIGPISAVRESSVLIAALIGVVMFGERPWRMRVLSAAIVAMGVVLLTVFA